MGKIQEKAGRPAKRGAVIESVEPGSVAADLDLRPEDVVVSLNGRPLRDVLDFRFYGADEGIELVIERAGRRFSCASEKQEGQPLGVEFCEVTFDGMRRCRNKCLFCFVDRMPRGLRNTLYVKDDDYRFSFLFGNFVTLVDLNEEDWARLAEQRLSPLYVSVHATDSALRRRLLGNPKAPSVLAQLERLASLNIQVHTQIVLCPGLNDGEALDRSILDLARLYPTVQSIGIVPVGLARTVKKRADLNLRSFEAEEALAVVAQVRRWQRSLRPAIDLNLAYLADEFYLLVGKAVPGAASYDGYPQLENGIGLTRLLLEDWSRLRRNLPLALPRRTRLTMVCGALIAPTLLGMVEELRAVPNLEIDLVPVANRLFGPNVTVSGLLTGADIIDALRRHGHGDFVAVSRASLDACGERFLDEVTPAEAGRVLGAEVIPAENVSELLRLLVQRASSH
jgi:putative radical SAM enzyme (TIGR03279 family)